MPLKTITSRVRDAVNNRVGGYLEDPVLIEDNENHHQRELHTFNVRAKNSI